MPVDVLTLFAAELEGQLNLTFVYSTELFKPSTIERMATDLRLLLEGAALAPDTRIWDLPMSAQQTTIVEDEVEASWPSSRASGRQALGRGRPAQGERS